MLILGKSKGLATRCGWLLTSLLAPVLLLVACLAPVANPIGVTTPTLPPLPPPVTVDLSGKIDSQGVLLDTVQIISSDGRFRVIEPEGSRLLDAKGQPTINSLTLIPYQPPESQYGVVVGLAYKWNLGNAEVAGATITPKEGPALMPNGVRIYSYDAPPANPRINPDKPDVAVWSDQTKEWSQAHLPLSVVDPTTRTLVGPQLRFQPSVVIYWYVDVIPPLFQAPGEGGVATPLPPQGG